jgi:hypothetical protein
LASHQIELVPLSSLYDSPLVRRKIAPKDKVKVASQKVIRKEVGVAVVNDAEPKEEPLKFETQIEIEEVQQSFIAPPPIKLDVKLLEL